MTDGTAARRILDPTVRVRAVASPPPPRFSPFAIVALLAGVIAFVLATILAAGTWRSRGRKSPSSSAFALRPASEPASAPPPPPPPPAAPTIPASAPATASGASASASSDDPPTALGPFDHDAARAALDPIGKKLAECKISHGHAVRVRVTFAAQGTVATATALGQSSRAAGPCIVAHVKEAVVHPFQGPANTAVYTLSVPR